MRTSEPPHWPGCDPQKSAANIAARLPVHLPRDSEVLVDNVAESEPDMHSRPVLALPPILLPAILVAALLAGCATPLEVGSITEIKPATGAKGVDVYEPKRLAGVVTPEFAGDQLLEVRTFTVKSGAGEVELSGVACTLNAADFSATMQTPAKVRVPLYRQQSSTLAISCEMPGYKKKMITVAAVDITREKRMSSAATGGLVGLVTVSAIDAFSDNTKNAWEYPRTKVVLTADEVASVR